MGSRIRSKLTYANITASLALFVALGGTGYAASQLPRNSVGANQIRSSAVGASELRTSAVTSRDIRNGSVAARDMSAAARKALTGPAGPSGPKGDPGSATDYRAIVSAGTNGGTDAYNESRVTSTAPGEYRVFFNGQSGPPADVSGCTFSATLATVSLGGGSPQTPEAGRITVGYVNDGGPAAVVKTYGADGTQKPQPFHITASC